MNQTEYTKPYNELAFQTAHILTISSQKQLKFHLFSGNASGIDNYSVFKTRMKFSFVVSALGILGGTFFWIYYWYRLGAEGVEATKHLKPF